MNIATFLISAIIVGLLFLAVRHIKKHGSCANCEQCRSRTGAGGSRSGCSGSSGGCSGCCGCGSKSCGGTRDGDQ